MNLIKSFSRPLLFSVIVIALAATASAFASTSSSNSTWSSDPSWATPPLNNTPPPSRRYNGSSDNSSATSYTVPSPKLAPFAPGSNNLALEMGQVFLMGNLGNNVSDSLGVGARYTYGVSDLFGFESSFGYSTHSNGSLSMVNAQAGLRTNLAWYDKVIPYFSLGMGFYRPSYDLNQLGASNTAGASLSPILFGVHLGPGVDLEVSKSIFFGASLMFNDVFGSTENTPEGQPFQVGGTYTTFFLHVGTTF